MVDIIKIGEAAKILGVSIDTLRKMDKSKKLPSQRKNKISGYRYYSKEAIENYLIGNVFKFARKWTSKSSGVEPYKMFYCPNSSIFQAKLSKLEFALSQMENLKRIFPLLIAISGEIGNNSFDHNIGSWPDVPGAFFGYNLNLKEIVLADRGQGILQTLKKVRPELVDDHEALNTAFTEIISGRAPENRGNGLKYVRIVVEKNPISLIFQTGSAELKIGGRDPRMKIKKAQKHIPGCLALIKF